MHTKHTQTYNCYLFNALVYILVIKISPFRLKQIRYLLVKALYDNVIFIVINDEFFIFKILLFLTFTSSMFVICLTRFQQYQLGLYLFLNKILQLYNTTLKYLSTR
jgi:hypothetical protein